MLTWEDAGTGEPGDQNSWDSAVPHAVWSLGPNDDGRWGVELIVRDEDGDEVTGDGVHLGSFPTEQAAKDAAETHETREG